MSFTDNSINMTRKFKFIIHNHTEIHNIFYHAIVSYSSYLEHSLVPISSTLHFVYEIGSCQLFAHLHNLCEL